MGLLWDLVFKKVEIKFGEEFGKCVICLKDIEEEEAKEIRGRRDAVKAIAHEYQWSQLNEEFRVGESLLKEFLGREEAYKHWYHFHFKDGDPYICTACFEKRFPPKQDEEKPKDKETDQIEETSKEGD